jgi:HSP20 family protein
MADLVKRDPFRSLFSFPRWTDDFDDLSFTTQRGLKVHETDKNILVEAVVAGVPASDVEVHIDGGVLTIKAEKSEESKKKGSYTASSFQYYYTCALSGGAWDKADAEVEDGVMTVRIPKTEAAKPKRITVKAKNNK